MADNIIKVNVTANKTQRVTVSSANVGTKITASSDTGKFWAQNAKNWAVSENIVDGEDYSSKYYANKSKGYAQNAENFEAASRDTYDNFINLSNETTDEIIGLKQTSITEIEDIKNSSVVDINATVDAGIADINNTKTNIITDIEFVADGEKEEIREIIDTGKEELQESIGNVKILTTLEIGDIGIAPLGIDESKGKRRYLNGQLIIQEQYVQFTNKVKSAIALYPSLACTESEWQTTATMTVGGQVGKFVVDDEAGTIRIPKIIMPIQGLTDLSKLGQIVEAGLPNITGRVNSVNGGASSAGTGAIVKTTSSRTGQHDGGSENQWMTLEIDASLSNPIYGNSNTAQQEQIQYPYFIQVATGAETEDNIINEIELNNPYSFGDSKYSPVALNNLSWLKSEGQYNSKAIYPAYYDWALTNFNNGVEGFALSTGEYTDYDVVINSAEETFRLPLLDGSEDIVDYNNPVTITSGGFTATKRCFVSAFGSITAQYQAFEMLVNGEIIAEDGSGNYTNNSARLQAFVKKGDVVTFQGSFTSFRGAYYPLIGNGSLYFYVGETVQNANLINAGRIEEKLSNFLSKDNKEEIVSWETPDYTAGITVAVGVDFKAPVCGVVAGEFTAAHAGVCYLYINGVLVEQMGAEANQRCRSTFYARVGRNDTVKVNANAAGAINLAKFYPLKGAK